jgi:YjbE family integral membrane protein
VAVRSVMTLGVVWLLQIPGLLAIGGILLLWIAFRLLVNEEHEGNGKTVAVDFFGAMRTIIVADAVMGVDNVLGVAGAAHGSYLLVVLGLLISVPIVVWGSTLILHFTERFPIIIYLGAAVLALTGVKMVTHEPLLSTALEARLAIQMLIYSLALIAVLGAGYLVNQSRRVCKAFRGQKNVRRELHRNAEKGADVMERILLPVDGSNNALAAVRNVIEELRRDTQSPVEREVLLLNVQAKFNQHIAQFVSRRNREEFREEQAFRAFRNARQLLDSAGIAYRTFTATGSRADVIARFAREHHCQRIVLGTARKNSLTRLLENSVTAGLLERATVPVQIVVGKEASRWERYGLPLGAGALLTAWIVLD